MTTQWILQKRNKSNYRRFVAKVNAEEGNHTALLEAAKKWNTETEANQFKLINSLFTFEVALSDGTDDREKEVAEYWASKEGAK